LVLQRDVIITAVLYPAVDLPIVQKVNLLHKLMKAAQVIALAVNMKNTNYMEVTKNTNWY
jgi:alanine dehydrogenase